MLKFNFEENFANVDYARKHTSDVNCIILQKIVFKQAIYISSNLHNCICHFSSTNFDNFNSLDRLSITKSIIKIKLLCFKNLVLKLKLI